MFLQKDRENYPQRSRNWAVGGYATGTRGVGGSMGQRGGVGVCVCGGYVATFVVTAESAASG